MQGVQGRFASHRYTSPPKQNKRRLPRVKGKKHARFLLLIYRAHGSKRGMDRISTCTFPSGNIPLGTYPHRHDVHASPIFKVFPAPRFFTDIYTHSLIPKSTHRKQRGVLGVHFFKMNRYDVNQLRRQRRITTTYYFSSSGSRTHFFSEGRKIGDTLCGLGLTYKPDMLSWGSSLREPRYIHRMEDVVRREGCA